jgi:hypothetical protein
MGQELVEPTLLPSIGQLPEHIGWVSQRRHSALGARTHQAVFDIATENDWIIVDMKKDWKEVFPGR